MAFITNLLWFWVVMGAIVNLTFWGMSLARAEGRAKFTDTAIRDKMERGATDHHTMRLAGVFGSRFGVVLLTFLCWPITLHAMLFSKKA